MSAMTPRQADDVVTEFLRSEMERTVESPDPMLQFFKFEHLRADLKDASMPFCLLAEQVVATLPRNPERTAALRKLLEAKDCAVRALLYES